jgi:hypothetical protein
VLCEPVEMVVDEPADVLVGSWALPQIGRLSAGDAGDAFERGQAEGFIALHEQPGPAPQIF